jgi:AmpD protein
MQRSRFAQIRNGVLEGATQLPSPNFNARPMDADIQLIVIHNISLPPSQFGGGYIQQFFQNKLDWSIILIFRPLKACRYPHIY